MIGLHRQKWSIKARFSCSAIIFMYNPIGHFILKYLCYKLMDRVELENKR